MNRWIILLPLIFSVGCTAVRETQPERTATEQLILSSAVVDAARQIQAEAVAGKKVVVDVTYLKTLDVEFTQGELRDRLLQLGAELVADSDQAEVIVEVRSGGLGIDESKTNIGIPSIPIPVPSVGTFQTPSAYIYKYERQEGKSAIAITGYESTSGKHLFSVRSLGKALHSDLKLLGIPVYKNREYLDRQPVAGD